MIIMETPATTQALGSPQSMVTSLPPGTEDVPNDPGCVDCETLVIFVMN